MIALLVPMMATAADLQGNAEYEYTISDDGKTATVTVSLSGYDKANSMMIIPEYDKDELELVEAYWLIRGALSAPWDETTGDAAIAFSGATNINKEIFEMVFEIKGDAKSLDSVGGELIVKSIDEVITTETTVKETTPPEPPAETNPPETNPPAETSSPVTSAPVFPPIGYDPIETNPPETKPAASVPVETNSPETNPPETSPPEPVPMETQLPETVATVTEPSEPESSEVISPETLPDEIDGADTEPISKDADTTENSNPSLPSSYPGEYKTADDDTSGKLVDGYMWLVVLMGSIVVLGVAALIVGVIWVKKKSR